MRKLIFILITLLTVSGVYAQDAIDFTVFIDVDSLTLYVPSSGSISLIGFGFQVQVNNAARTYELADYPAFGLPFGSLPTPICFRLSLSGSRTPLPVSCTGVPTLSQNLAAADVFWYDSVALTARTILVTLDGAPFTICPPGASACEGSFAPITGTSTPEVMVTPTSTAPPTGTISPRWHTFTTEQETLSFDMPPGWVLDEINQSQEVEVFLSTDQNGLEALESLGQFGSFSAEQFVSGFQGILVLADEPVDLFIGIPIRSMQDVIDYWALDWIVAGITIDDERVITVGNRQAALITGSALQGDLAILTIDIDGWYALLKGYAAPGELDELLPIMEQLAELIQIP